MADSWVSPAACASAIAAVSFIRSLSIAAARNLLAMASRASCDAASVPLTWTECTGLGGGGGSAGDGAYLENNQTLKKYSQLLKRQILDTLLYFASRSV